MKVALALALIAGNAVAQSPPSGTLAAFIPSLHWDAAKYGPLVALEPESVMARQTGAGLAAFGRMQMSLPGITAIVPDTMVVIDDSKLQPPNMYDGLPREAKVLYLMTTLNAGQWEAATGAGLAMSDLTSDQQAVFRSILPAPFVYSTFTVGDDRDARPVDQGTQLSDSDLSSVRLHLERSLSFMCPIVGQPNSMTSRNTSFDSGKPGSKFAQRDFERDKPVLFGMNLRQTVPNRLKSGNLDYQAPALRASIGLMPSERVSDLLSRIAKAAGLEIRADLRVGNRKLACLGSPAPMSSVLKAIALSVTGTYRKVGPAYILTSDLVGIGTRKVNLADYDRDLLAKVWNEETAWRQQIYQSGRLDQIRYRSDDSLTPGDSLTPKLDQDSPGSGSKISSSDLTSDLQKFIQRQNQLYTTQQVTADGASVYSEFGFSFILPSGIDAKPESDSLGDLRAFRSANAESRPQPAPPSIPKVDVGPLGDRAHLCLSAENPVDGRHAAELAVKFGFKDLWLDTLSPAALPAALESAAATHVKVSLAVRPFDYRGLDDDAFADRTIYGDSPTQSMQRRLADPDASLRQVKMMDSEPVGCISPLSTGFQLREQAVIRLAETPGLAGVHIMTPTPNGYNGPRVNYISFPSTSFFEKGNFGYAEELRLSFIREHSVDPVDLCPPNINTNADLRQPFFLDDGLRGMNSSYDGTDQPDPAIAGMMGVYDTWLAKLNRTGLKALLDGVSSAHVPISVEAFFAAMNTVNHSGSGLVDWKSGDPLPELADNPRGQQLGFEKYVFRAVVSEWNPVLARAALAFLSARATEGRHDAGIVFDLSALPTKLAEQWLTDGLLEGHRKS